MRSSRLARWRGIPMLAWIGLIGALTGAGVLVEGLAPRAALAQVEVFVTNFLGDSVTTYSRTARGALAPLRIIRGPGTGLLAPSGVVGDTANNEILVANISSVTVYSLTVSGDAAPLRTISGAATGLVEPIGLAVDTARNEILVANARSITVYSRAANGNVAPLRTITGPSTGLNDPFGLALDTARGEVLVANFRGNAITVYNRTASGDAAPIRTIGGAATGLQRPAGIALDTARDEVLVTNERSITVYRRTATGNVPPLRAISGESTELQQPIGLTVDAGNNEVLVSNFASNAVTVFARTASGNAAPLRVIDSELAGPAFSVVAATCPPVFDFDFSGNSSINAYTRCFRDLVRGNQITAGNDLGGTRHTSLNVSGSSGTTPTTWLTVYDGTPTSADPGPTFGAQTLCADVLAVPFNNIKGAGVVALLNEGSGKKGLALVIHEAGNTDTLFLATVDGDPLPQMGKLTTLASVSLGTGILGRAWYRLIMTVDPARATVTGEIFAHTTPSDPNSALGEQVGSTLTYQAAALPAGVTSPGEIGILASSINAVLNVSVTNFSNNAVQCGP